MLGACVPPFWSFLLKLLVNILVAFMLLANRLADRLTEHLATHGTHLSDFSFGLIAHCLHFSVSVFGFDLLVCCVL